MGLTQCRTIHCIQCPVPTDGLALCAPQVAPYAACLRGRVFAPTGFLKLVFNRADGVVLGVHSALSKRRWKSTVLCQPCP